MSRARKIRRFLLQPMFVAEAFTIAPRRHVKLEDTVRRFRRIVTGELDDLRERRSA